MKIVCNSSQLSRICQNVQRAVSSKSTLPALEGILIKALGDSVTLTGYDLELGSETYMQTYVEENGSIILNARHLCDILRMLPDSKVTIESDERQICKIISGEAEYSLIGTDASEYPELPGVSGGYSVVIKKSILKDMIKKTIFAVATNENKPVHTGIKFEISNNKIILIAVDGYRLAVRREEIEYDGEDISFVVPAKTLNEIVKLAGDDDGDYSISVGKRHICFQVNEYRIISRLLEGDFIDYNAAIPLSATTTAEVNTRSLIESIERTSLIITDRTKSPVRCIVDEANIRLSSITSIGTAADRIMADVKGKRVEIGFNNRYMLDALRVCDADEVRLEFNGSITPILILPTEGDSFLFLVLPVRLKNEA